MTRKQVSGLSLVVAVDKPAGMTSHDVVNRCRKVFNESRVGHMGTLDPFATGLLPICIGPATRLNAYASQAAKSYIATIEFGTKTDTDDCEGNVIEVAILPAQLADESYATGVLEGFCGEQLQTPPVYSAIKKNGVKAYEAARRGETIEITPRRVTVYDARLLTITASNGAISWDVDFTVSHGTYIRSLARDIGIACGSVAHLEALRRTSVGELTLAQSYSLEELEEKGASAAVNPLDLIDCGIGTVDDNQIAKIQNGNALETKYISGINDLDRALERSIAIVSNNKLFAIYEWADSGLLKPECVFSIPVQCQ